MRWLGFDYYLTSYKTGLILISNSLSLMHQFFKLIYLFLTLFLYTLFIPNPVFAATIPYKITDTIPGKPVTNRDFFTTNFTVNYSSGKIIFSANSDATGFTFVDDAIQIIVTHSDNSTSEFLAFYERNCFAQGPHLPEDITYAFRPGNNQVKVRLFDVCRGFVGSTSLYLVNTNAPDPPPVGPTPFLDLPWDYQAKGLSFNEAANSISSFFDHEYPLLSSGLAEPINALTDIMDFRGPPKTTNAYSSHDGYDYAKGAKVNIGDPVLAAAAGVATYVNSCGACGNMVLIDHQNGYQTRYLHMQKDGLITNIPGQKVNVTTHQQIGKVGATGNVFPAGDAGAHIHFGVFQDKNKDGNFDDNIPDGVTDPFGWQSKEVDPWENYSFFYNGKNRTGNKSFYLWKKKLDNLDATLTSNGGVFQTERFKLNFPQNATNKNLNLNLTSEPVIKISNSLQSLGSTLLATAKDSLGNLINTFQSFFTLTIDFSKVDTSKIKQDTISIYSSQDGVSWAKENTLVDSNTKTASAQLNHFTHFALMAERLDTEPPSTNVLLIGDKGQEDWYRSDVNVTLDPTDNPGGLGIDYTMIKIDGADWEIYTDPIIISSEGHHKIQFYSADLDENMEDFKSAEFDIDKTPPVINQITPDRSPDFSEWYNHSLTITFSGTDPLSGIDSCSSINYDGPDRVDAEIEGNCQDKAGNTTKERINFKYDSTKPDISATGTTSQGIYTQNSWVNQDVTVIFDCQDQTSGILKSPVSEIISAEGENQPANGICQDNAGNINSLEFNGINIDKTAPQVSIDANPQILWPPNGKKIEVLITGDVFDLHISDKNFSVLDEYNLIAPPISDFNQTIQLEAKRDGGDLDGRRYTIKVAAEDLAKNKSEASTEVIVPHDQR